MSEYQAPTNAPSNAPGLAPATAGRGGEPFGLSSPHPGRAVAAAPGRPAAVVPAFLASQGGLVGVAEPAFFTSRAWGGTGDPRLPFRHMAAPSQAPPSRGWHVASYRPAPLQTLTVRENRSQRGRSPVGRGDLPGKRPLVWTVPGFERRPSGKTASGVDGGWFQVGDYPHRSPQSRKVGGLGDSLVNKTSPFCLPT